MKTTTPPPTAFQDDLWGKTHVAGDIVARITFLLETLPETRNDYKTLMAYYWLRFDGLESGLHDAETFTKWFTTCATSPKTIQNRCMEVQSARPDLEADTATQKLRARQAKAGPIRQ
jgi:hypothetical protein